MRGTVFTVNRDTIHIKDISLGYENQFLKDYAIDGEYNAGWKLLVEE